MQSRIAQAHYDVAEEVSDSMNGWVVIEAEVWFRTYIRNTDNDFNALYLPNDHHPSEIGTRLLSAVIMNRAFGILQDLPIVDDCLR